ncbi:hypothetical protein AAZX31_01G144200 [Glycine max]|uniref:Subtilisin-like protease SBT1.7 n=1 Tax=Glycine soja TaxID=3848 RepID=A0A445M3M0_GLYSO|nr:subtilisin-like protease SBT1.7 [Glycine soja]KAG5069595.1 hypothetical protein JHK85_001972 [Glycine max]RZC30160.1 Subtilisin-like protease SBT1.7 [Glycine soja]
MEMFLKPFVATLLVLFFILYDVSLATMENKSAENPKGTYIVHLAKSEMPSSFNQHSIWYKSVLKSASNSAEMLYTYDNVIHGFSTRLTHEEAWLLRSQAGILKVQPEKIYKPHTTRTPHFLGLDKIADMVPESNEGSDIIIGLLDTGVWPESKSFDDTGLGPIPNTWKGKCESSVDFNASSCNKKLIGARSYSKGYEAMMGPIIGITKSPRDIDGHGSHTASTAAGSVVKGASLFGYASGTARGMASRARVAVYKVCWKDSCVVSDILAAIDAAISDNVNVLSISLGGGGSKYYDDDGVAIGAFAAMEKGILVSCSAGNDGPDPSSLGSNTAPWVITVGAGTIDRDFPAYVSLGNGKNYSGVSLFSGNSLPDNNSLFPITYAGIASFDPLGNECLFGSLDPKKVKGKIVLCDLGNIPMAEKGFAVKSAGGVGLVLGTVENDGEEQATEPTNLPTIVVGIEATKAIKKYLLYDPKSMATIVSQGTKVGIEPSPVVAEFSSRGPNLLTPQVMKPDLIAPGVDILGAWTRHKGPTDYKEDHRRVDFNIISGTSMSCPHVSGIAAIIKSVNPNWSPAAIRSALMTTAYSTYTNGKSLIDSATNKSSTPFDIGAGHVNPVLALNPGLVYDLTTTDDYLHFLCALNYTPKRIESVARRKYKCDPHKHYNVADLNYPSFSVVYKTNNPTIVKHTRTLTNVGVAGTYNVSVTLDIPSVKIVVEPNVLSFNQNENKSYTVTFTPSGPSPSTGFGFGRLEWSNGKNIVGSPISIYFEPPGVIGNS